MTSLYCRLPSLPDRRKYHTQSGSMICGGWASSVMRSCLQWSAGEGEWTKLPLSLHQRRYLHSSWSPPGSGGGTFLFGGGGLKDGHTSEYVTNDTRTKTFTMKYDTKYTFKWQHCTWCMVLELPAAFLWMTEGGFWTKKKVSEYSQEGWERDLTYLNMGRYGHGCSSFVSVIERVKILADQSE